jgi:hypothetical protein
LPGSNINSSPDQLHASVVMAQQAADGDPVARKQVSDLVHDIISYQTTCFCKRFCHDNRFRYRCTLPTPWGSPPPDAVLCEWGNASYGWMLNDLTNSDRLRRFEGRHGASIKHYLFQIANSLAFYERWKDWRIGRKVHVPTYVQDLSPHAGKVFLELRNQQDVALIAQKLGEEPSEIAALAQRIIVELTRRNRLYLLDPVREVSLTGLGKPDDDEDASHDAQADVAWREIDPEQIENNQRLLNAWDKLTPVEQFILETMVIENQDAMDVLSALQRLDIAIADGVSAKQTNRQQLYYFRRKTIAKLAELSGLN